MIVDFESMKQVFFFLLWLAEWLKRNPNIAFVVESLCKIISESNSEDMKSSIGEFTRRVMRAKMIIFYI